MTGIITYEMLESEAVTVVAALLNVSYDQAGMYLNESRYAGEEGLDVHAGRFTVINLQRDGCLEMFRLRVNGLQELNTQRGE